MTKKVTFSSETLEEQAVKEENKRIKEASKNLILLARNVEKARHFSVQSLIDQGADINFQDEYGNTPLIIAAHNGLMSIVEELVKNNADQGIKDKQGCTALMAANLNGKTEVAEFLSGRVGG